MQDKDTSQKKRKWEIRNDRLRWEKPFPAEDLLLTSLVSLIPWSLGIQCSPAWHHWSIQAQIITPHSIAPPTRIPDQNPANISLWDFRQNPDLGSNSMSKGTPWIFTKHVCGSSIKHTVRILSLFVPRGLKGTGNTLSAQKPCWTPLSCYSRMPLTILRKAAQRHWYSTYHGQVGTHSFLLYNTPGFIVYVVDSFRFILCIRHLFFFSKWVLGWYSYWLFPHFSDS